MATRFELVWKGADGVERSVPVVDFLTVGRGPRNDILVPDDEMSWAHARFWQEGDKLLVDDAGSTNGTFVGAQRILQPAELKGGSVVRFGGHTTVLVRESQGDPLESAASWLIEDLGSGIRHPLHQRFVVGAGRGVDLRVEGAATHTFVRDGASVRLESGGNSRALRTGEIVDDGPLKLRLLVAHRSHRPERTARPTWGPSRYQVEASIEGRSPYASIRSPDGVALEVEGETRATLVFVLAQAVVESRRAGASPEEEGWLDDLEAVTRVWGRTAPAEVSNRLSVVVYRLRAALKELGMSSDFIERSRGRVRILAAEVSLQ